jgi:predicted ATP-dependent endonuclease of OLD family
MEKLIIENFGPIASCEVDVADFVVLIGEQASGKSTIAKSIYYCKLIRDKLKEVLIDAIQVHDAEKLYAKFSKKAKKDFFNFFGTTLHLEQFKIEYFYSEHMSVTIALSPESNGKKYLVLEFSKALDVAVKRLIRETRTHCSELESDEVSAIGGQHEKTLHESKKTAMSLSIANKANEIFNDFRHYLFIPAGRSVITTLSESLESIYKNMEFVDSLTYEFINEMIRFKRRFDSIEQLIHVKTELQESDMPKEYVEYAKSISQNILKGRYGYDKYDGREKFYIENTDMFIKLNLASSGQQETVWIINLLLYYIVYNIECQVFIEEPEAHLFPTAQQDIVRFVANFFNANKNNRVIIPTHSPYVLSEINNLTYAHRIKSLSPEAEKAILGLVDKRALIPPDRLRVYNVAASSAEDIIDADTQLIDFAKLDEPAARPINELFNKLYDLEDAYSGSELG